MEPMDSRGLVLELVSFLGFEYSMNAFTFVLSNLDDVVTAESWIDVSSAPEEDRD